MDSVSASSKSGESVGCPVVVLVPGAGIGGGEHCWVIS